MKRKYDYGNAHEKSIGKEIIICGYVFLQIL
jgi:hypothetical protein